MSQNRGGQLVRQSTSDKPGRPSLDRPSLFAGMDNEDSTFGSDTQRVRILSTLESTRRPSGRKGLTKIHGITKKKRSNWQTKALIGLMGVGVLTLLTSFVMVIMDGHSSPARPESGNKPAATAEGIKRTTGLAPNAAANTSNPLAALIAPPQHPAMAPAQQQSAVIENVINTPPAMQPTEPKLASIIPAPEHNTTPSGSSAIKPVDLSRQAASVATAPPTTAAPKLAAATPAPLQPPAKAQPQAPVHDSATTASTSGSSNLDAKLSMPPAKRTPARKSKDEDVALLEAMFAHTRPRPASVSVADELKQRCGSLSGAEAATCRARVCVQNPTAAVCHQD